MDQLIEQITSKTGISDDQARQVVQIVAGFLKDKLPAPLAGQLDAILGGGTPSSGDAIKDVLGGLGGLLK